jgi:hypothetical protein
LSHRTAPDGPKLHPVEPDSRNSFVFPRLDQRARIFGKRFK